MNKIIIRLFFLAIPLLLFAMLRLVKERTVEKQARDDLKLLIDNNFAFKPTGSNTQRQC